MSRRISTAMLVIALGVGGCGSPTLSPSPSPLPTPALAGTPATTPTPTPTTAPSPTSEPTPTTAPWPTAEPTPTTAPSVTSGALTWLSLGGNESASITVPLDYDHSSAGTVKLAVVRRKVPDSSQRIGTLFLNPGGPGGSGVAMLSGVDSLLPPEITTRFDLVSWDPRGVGLSRGLTCPDQPTIAKVEALDPTPTTAGALAQYRTVFDLVAAQCQSASGDLLPYLSEANTARDMDAIRDAMGETTISYWAWSYGTYLGYVYATMFPTRLRAAVLDGPVDPNLDLQGRDDGQARGFQNAFDHDLALCAAARACPFYNGGNPAKAYADLMAHLDRQPIASGPTQLGAGEATTGILTFLYSSRPQPLMQALADAQRGDAATLLGMANAYYAQIQLGSYLATSCLDVEHLPTPDAIDRALAATQASAPKFAGQVLLTDAFGCLDWPVAANQVKVGAPPSGLPPILVLASTHDPATPPFMAQPLANALGTGIVLTRDGIGHTTGSSMIENACLSNAATAYMRDLTAPARNTVCKDPAPTFGP